jgi:hypothetical protein
MGPWFVIIAAVFTLSISPALLSHQRPGESPFPALVIPPVFFVVGLVMSYVAYFRRPNRLEMNDETLSWFLPFRRLKGEAPIVDIDTIWTEQTFQWRRTRTVIVLGDGRTVRVNDGKGINAFVAALAARSPEIHVADWEAQRRFDTHERLASFYLKDDD